MTGAQLIGVSNYGQVNQTGLIVSSGSMRQFLGALNISNTGQNDITITANGDAYLQSNTGNIILSPNYAKGGYIRTSGNIIPTITSSFDIGSRNYKIRSAYASDTVSAKIIQASEELILSPVGGTTTTTSGSIVNTDDDLKYYNGNSWETILTDSSKLFYLKYGTTYSPEGYYMIGDTVIVDTTKATGGGSSGAVGFADVIEITGQDTLTLDHANTYITANKATAFTIYIAEASDVNFDIGTTITIEQSGAGRVTVAKIGTVTLNGFNGGLTTAGQYAVIRLVKINTNAWTCIGGTP